MKHPADPTAHRPLPRALVALTGFIALVEVVLWMGDSGILFDPSLRLRVMGAGAFWSPLVHGAEPLYAAQPVTMFVSHALLHGGFLHMAMNMAILLAMGRFVADRYTAAAILPIFLAGAIAGGAVYGLITNVPIPMVGASGAVFAFLGVWIVWDWRRHVAAGISPQPVLVRVAVLAGLNVAAWIALDGMLAWEAHLGGFLAGLLCGSILENRARDAAIRANAAERARRLRLDE
jgi:membrane associated rhomboid family serine protease